MFEEATKRRVILASPMTIAPLIYIIAHGWQQQKLADNARELGSVVEILGDRLFVFINHLQGVRNGIAKAAKSWDDAIASWQKRVSPQLDKVKSLGGKLKETEELLPIEPLLGQLEEKTTQDDPAVKTNVG
jgi:DNA recombination protein RmuC